MTPADVEIGVAIAMGLAATAGAVITGVVCHILWHRPPSRFDALVQALEVGADLVEMAAVTPGKSPGQFVAQTREQVARELAPLLEGALGQLGLHPADLEYPKRLLAKLEAELKERRLGEVMRAKFVVLQDGYRRHRLPRADKALRYSAEDVVYGKLWLLNELFRQAGLPTTPINGKSTP